MSVTFVDVHKTLRQKHKKTTVFSAASADFASDRINGILAHPGSGKSTATQLTTGKLRPDVGKVSRSSLVSFPIAGGGIFNGLLSGRDNLAFLCRVFGFDPRPIIRFVSDFTEIGKGIDKPFKHFTRDERTRMIFASSFAIPFEVYVADEAVIGGRGAFRDRCEELVRERMKTSGFIIFSSSPAFLKKHCNEFYVIDECRFHKVDSIDAATARIGNVQPGSGNTLAEETAANDEANDIDMF